MTIFEAFSRGDTAALTRLLDDDASVKAVDEHGWTLLHWAAGRGDLGLVTRLVERGADVFARGRDQRTPYLVALAAGRRDVVSHLSAAEERAGGDRDGASSRQAARRQYCTAFPIEALQAFPEWPEGASDSASQSQSESGARLGEARVLFLHHDFTVTRSVLHGDDLLPAVTSTQAWRSFCVDRLGVQPKTDIDLLSAE